MSDFLWFWVTFLFLYVLYKYFSRNVNYWKERGVKGPEPIPFFGNLLDIFKTPITELEIQRSQKYGKIYGFLELTQPVLSVSDIELIKLITMKDFHCFTNHQNLTPGDPFMSKILVNMVDNEWRRVRNICIPAFTHRRIRRMLPMVNKVVDNAIAYFDEMAELQKPIETQATFSSFAMDVVAHTVFGAEVNSFKNPDGEYSRYASNIMPIASPRVIIGLLMPSWLRRLLGFSVFSPKGCDFFKTLVKHVVTERKGLGAERKDLLHMLLNAEISDVKSLAELNDENLTDASAFDVKQGNRKLNEEEILAQGIMMVIAGTETTGTTMMYLLFNIAKRPEVQEKLYKELKHYFENEKFDYDSLIALPYLDAVIHETLRRYSPVVQFDRVANCDYELGETGITIEKGTVINIPFHAIHLDPDYWQNPYEFNPDRFLPENKNQIHPNAFCAFGFGPRICLGQKLGMCEIKAITANIVYRYEVLKTDKTPDEPIYTGKKITNHCVPIYIRLKKRA